MLTPVRSPVAFLIFNRPDTTAQVFARIVAARPSRLFVVADGPRPGHRGDAEACAATRAITEKIDWPCEVMREYAEVNLGCARRVSTGLDWVFSRVEDAIILEDDCVPDPTFFPFCDELLERFRDDERVMCISGDNFQGGHQRTRYSYYFSIFNHIWGWATWRRAWRHSDLAMATWPELRDGGWLVDIFGDRYSVRYWTDVFERACRREIDTWDYAWMYACWAQSGLTVLPNVNLVSNIGFDERATHTKFPTPRAMVPAGEMSFPLIHPAYMVRDTRADHWTQRHYFRVKEPRGRAAAAWRFAGKISRVLPSGAREWLRAGVHRVWYGSR
jgi:hypothetical protein